MLSNPEPGLMIRYSYLWRDEYVLGREEGIKDRPCAIIAAIRKSEDDKWRVLVLPVTHTAPNNTELAVEIPSNIKRNLGLDGEKSWIVISESNEFCWPGPDLRRTGSSDNSTIGYGFLPPRFFDTVRKRFIALEEQKRTNRVLRTE